MDEKKMDPVELKKKILMPHLDFVKSMLVKVKGTNIEEKWKIMYECITSDKKRPSYEKIKQIENTLISLKNQSKQKSGTPSSSSKTVTSQMPSDSKANKEETSSKRVKTPENDAERDPRKRICTAQNSSTIYKPGQQNEPESSSRNYGQSSNHVDQPIRHPSNNNWHERSFQGAPRYQKEAPFSRRSFDSNPRFAFNKRGSFSGRSRGRYEGNRNFRGRDDFHFKRKRSQSPPSASKRSSFPKRRYSCHESIENIEISTSENPSRNVRRDETSKITRSNTSNFKEIDRSKTQSPSFLDSKNKTDTSQKIKVTKSTVNESKNTIENKKETESFKPTALGEAIKKIQSFRIPKVDAGGKTIPDKNSLKVSVTKTKDLDKNLEGTIIEKADSITGNKNASVEQIACTSSSASKIIKLQNDKIEKFDQNESLQKSAIEKPYENEQSEEISEQQKTTEVEESSDEIQSNSKAATEEKTKTDSKDRQIDSKDSNETDKENEKTEETLDESKIVDTNTKEIKPEPNQTKPSIEVQKDTPTSLEKPEKVIQKASELTNFLEDEEENPEKILENLVSILGAEKVKKMKELLLKNTVSTTSNSETKCDQILNKNELNENQSVDSISENITEPSGKSQEENEKLEKDDNKIDHQKEMPSVLPVLENKSPTKSEKSSMTAAVKPRKKPRKKLSELDKLHHDIITGIDAEGIFRACLQPRISTKTKIYDSTTSADSFNDRSLQKSVVTRNKETRPCSIKLIRINLRKDDMPVVINDDFYKNYLTFEETKSRTVPRKKIIVPQEKSIVEIEFKPEPINLPPVIVEEKQQIKTDETMKHEKETNSKVNSFKKKKRKDLLWSKGIVKKKSKRFKLIPSYDWEDVDSSDDNADYDSTMKLKNFKCLLNKFALKCGYKKIPQRTILYNNESGIKEESENESNMKAIPKENDTQPVSKRINLPLEKNLLTLISKINSNTDNNSTNSLENESPNPNITVKLPTLDKTNVSPLPTIQQNDNTVKPSLLVKPLSKDTSAENIKSRSLSIKEREELKAAIDKSSLSNQGVPRKSDDIIQNMLSNLSASLNIKKISVPKTSEGTSTSKNDAIKKNIPMISNVASISPKVATVNTLNQLNQKVDNTPQSQNLRGESNKINTVISNNDAQTNSLIESSIQNSNNVTNSNATKIRIQSVTELNKNTTKLPENVPKTEEVEVVDLVDDDDDDFIDILRPWIEKSDFKSRKQEIEAIKMVNNVHCLGSLYKCMGSTCGYYTNDKELFNLHLELHRIHQSTDSLNFLLCCYCSFRPNSISLLITHLENAHGYGKFGCRYCFYRSVNEYQVTANHHINFHRNKEKCVVLFEPKKLKNENLEKTYISETIPKVCQPLTCPYCRTGIYTRAEFEVHLQMHTEKYTTYCAQCKEPTNKLTIVKHLFKCFNKFGNYQCVFCSFGTCNFSSIDSHLSTEHPDKMSYFAERTLNSGKHPTSVESLTTKELSKKITGNVKRVILKYSFDHKIFENAENCGRLSEELVLNVDHKKTETTVKIPRKLSTSTEPSTSACSLQIGQVRSLHN